MATNYFFRNFSSPGEQGLIEDLIIESIRMYGVDTYYLPRTVINLSDTFREQETASFNQALSIEAYVKNINGFDGDGEFLSSFGVEVRQQITFSIARRSFDQEVGQPSRRDRPYEGDIIWFPFDAALYQIKYVDIRPIFYQMGSLQMYDVTCELFEYSNETFNTGVPVIDNTYNHLQTSIQSYDILTESDGLQLLTENGVELFKEEYDIQLISTDAQNVSFNASVVGIVDFTEIDPFSESQMRI